MNGQYLRGNDRQLIDEADTFLWLTEGDLKAETVSEIAAAQDKALHTKYLGNKNTDGRDRQQI
jgi:hypothetical protein